MKFLSNRVVLSILSKVDVKNIVSNLGKESEKEELLPTLHNAEMNYK